ncbi:MAG: energy transducer TonB [Candidatus Kapabacteria bacterium]|jgi:TonB family protein|nr:energy transducer TonB [Candidatus Kapabacteria bacterium]
MKKNIQKSICIIQLTVFWLTMSGCATIFKGERSTLKFVGIDKNFPLEVQMQNGQVLFVEKGSDFQSVTLSCKRDHILRLRHRDKEAFVKAQRILGLGWLALDAAGGVLTGFATAFYLGFVASIIDVTTSSWYEFQDISITPNDSLWTTIPPEKLRQDSLDLAQLTSFESPYIASSLRAEDSVIINNPFGVMKIDSEPSVDIRELQYNAHYPSVAVRGGIEGIVVLRVLIDREGNCIKGFVIQSTSELFNRSAMQAARYTKFTPAFLNGLPILRWMEIPIRYRIRY